MAVSHEAVAEAKMHCGPTHYIGSSPVAQPYIYYRNASAPGFGKNSTVVGDNYSCPRKG
eukprot:gene10520-1513_t